MPLNPEQGDHGLAPGARSDAANGELPSEHPAAPAVALQRRIAASSEASSDSQLAVEDAYAEAWKDSGSGPPPPGGSHAQLPPSGGEPPELGKMSFLDHLEELRTRIMRSLISIAVAFCFCWWKSDWMYGKLSEPLTKILHQYGMNDRLVYTNPTEVFTVYLEMSLVASLFLASWYILAQVWGFISPGLYPREKRYALPFVAMCTALFISGGAFAYYMAFPAALRYLIPFGARFVPMITVSEYFSLAVTVILGMALVFELPVLMLFLTFLHILSPAFLWRNSRYAILVIFILAAAITPTPDVPTMMLFATPLVGLYFLGMGLSYLVVRLRGGRA